LKNKFEKRNWKKIIVWKKIIWKKNILKINFNYLNKIILWKNNFNLKKKLHTFLNLKKTNLKKIQIYSFNYGGSQQVEKQH